MKQLQVANYTTTADSAVKRSSRNAVKLVLIGLLRRMTGQEISDADTWNSWCKSHKKRWRPPADDGPVEPPGPRNDFDKSWRNIWGTIGCLRPLAGVEAVALINDRLPMPSDLSAADFQLHSESKATGWTIDGKSIGADIATVKQAGPKQPAQPQASGNTPKNSRKPAF